jgi:hypothetical protein
MSTITPLHQFEIRYSAILNFPNVIRDIIAPYVKLASRINIENEGTHSERIVLGFDNEYYQIVVSWDRIFFRFEGDKDHLANNNSVVETPFFNLFGKIRDHHNFGEVRNILFVSFIIFPIEITEEILLEKFMAKYLVNTNKILVNPTDIGIVLDHNVDNKQISLNFGPYFGEKDLSKRKIIPTNPSVKEITNKLGLCLEFKYLNIVNSINFADYKEITKIEQEYYEKLKNHGI